MKNIKEYWDTLHSMPRNEVLKLAKEEVLDVRGLSILKNILYKYNLSNVTIDYKLNISFKKSKDYCPQKEVDKK